MKTFEEIETMVTHCRKLVGEGWLNSARATALKAHADTLTFAKSFPRGSFEETRALHFLSQFNDIVRDASK